MKDYPNCRPGETPIKNLRPGARFKLNLGNGASRTGVVVSQGLGQTRVKYGESTGRGELEALLGDCAPAEETSNTVGISPGTAVTEL